MLSITLKQVYEGRSDALPSFLFSQSLRLLNSHRCSVGIYHDGKRLLVAESWLGVLSMIVGKKKEEERCGNLRESYSPLIDGTDHL